MPESEKSRDAFLPRQVRHDIKNNLNNIRGALGAFRVNHKNEVYEGYSKDKLIQEMLEILTVIEENVQRLSAVVEQVRGTEKK